MYHRLSAAIRSQQQSPSTAGRVSPALINLALRSSLTEWTVCRPRLTQLSRIIDGVFTTSSSSSGSGRRHRLLVTTASVRSNVERRRRTLTLTYHHLLTLMTMTQCRYIRNHTCMCFSRPNVVQNISVWPWPVIGHIASVQCIGAAYCYRCHT